MHRAILNIQGINEDSNEFQTEIKNNAEENKECEDENSTPNVQHLTRDANKEKDNNEKKDLIRSY